MAAVDLRINLESEQERRNPKIVHTIFTPMFDPAVETLLKGTKSI